MSKLKSLVKRLNPLPPIAEWLRNLFREEYTLDIWYPANQYGTRAHEEYHFKKISKLSQTHIKGLDPNGKTFELKTTAPFDYRVRRTY